MADVAAVTDLLAKTTVDQPLAEVSFAERGLKLNSAEDAKVIVDAIKESPEMHSLVLNGNTVGVEAAQAIAEVLEEKSEFQRARWFDIFTGRLRSEIPPALKSLGAAIIKSGAHLVELDLSDNAFGPDGVKAVKDLLESPACYSLKELRFNNQGLGLGGKILAESLIKCHQEGSNVGTPLCLKVFVAGRNRLENPGAIALAKAFKTIGTLEEISMPQNGIKPEGIEAMADAVVHSPKLRILNLNDNTFTSRGAIAMAKALTKADNLEVLNFGDCLIRSEGASALAETISNGLPNLREVIFSFGEIRKDAALKVAESVEEKSKLEILDLNGNSLGEDGVELLMATLEAINKKDVLASLSDDEGTADEDEGEEEDGDDDDDDEGEERDDPELQVRGQSITPSPRKPDIDDTENVEPCTAAAFLAFPSLQKFQGLGNDSEQKLLKELGDKSGDYEEVVKVFVKVAAVMDVNTPKVKQSVQQCADALLSELFKSENCRAENVANEFLVHLGYIKSEDKKFKPVSNPVGLLQTLDHVVQQEYFPRKTISIFTAVMSLPNESVDQYIMPKHNLMQTLYKL
ncbi:Ran GTPase-activating protein 1 [Holothuria leucospilota]|uniref:Ran GTPase-activating protein 1 n=1 Tax=Holothuria leucospilota TaxID=206669 RepID=A0A9Q1C2R9_HOLLE|nr:Ran GTPase-activating protein 1 [Holothuria leucospilota]